MAHSDSPPTILRTIVPTILPTITVRASRVADVGWRRIVMCFPGTVPSRLAQS